MICDNAINSKLNPYYSYDQDKLQQLILRLIPLPIYEYILVVVPVYRYSCCLLLNSNLSIDRDKVVAIATMNVTLITSIYVFG